MQLVYVVSGKISPLGHVIWQIALGLPTEGEPWAKQIGKNILQTKILTSDVSVFDAKKFHSQYKCHCSILSGGMQESRSNCEPHQIEEDQTVN